MGCEGKRQLFWGCGMLGSEALCPWAFVHLIDTSMNWNPDLITTEFWSRSMRIKVQQEMCKALNSVPCTWKWLVNGHFSTLLETSP